MEGIKTCHVGIQLINGIRNFLTLEKLAEKGRWKNLRQKVIVHVVVVSWAGIVILHFVGVPAASSIASRVGRRLIIPSLVVTGILTGLAVATILTVASVRIL